jgi:hypothetical protein
MGGRGTEAGGEHTREGWGREEGKGKAGGPGEEGREGRKSGAWGGGGVKGRKGKMKDLA